MCLMYRRARLCEFYMSNYAVVIQYALLISSARFIEVKTPHVAIDHTLQHVKRQRVDSNRDEMVTLGDSTARHNL